jgi:hypothetical protein
MTEQFHMKFNHKNLLANFYKQVYWVKNVWVLAHNNDHLNLLNLIRNAKYNNTRYCNNQ